MTLVRRRIVHKSIKRGRRVVVATHMLESMIANPLPTRAEGRDVAKAVFTERGVMADHLGNLRPEADSRYAFTADEQVIRRLCLGCWPRRGAR